MIPHIYGFGELHTHTHTHKYIYTHRERERGYVYKFFDNDRFVLQFCYIKINGTASCIFNKLWIFETKYLI